MKAREQRQNEDKEYMIIANTMSVVYNRARGNENLAAVQLVWARNKLCNSCSDERFASTKVNNRQEARKIVDELGNKRGI